MTILLRFMAGAVLALSVAAYAGLDFPFIVVFVLAVGTVAAIWGDRFILGFLSVIKHFR
jgi:hypothetical protein